MVRLALYLHNRLLFSLKNKRYVAFPNTLSIRESYRELAIFYLQPSVILLSYNAATIYLCDFIKRDLRLMTPSDMFSKVSVLHSNFTLFTWVEGLV